MIFSKIEEKCDKSIFLLSYRILSLAKTILIQHFKETLYFILKNESTCPSGIMRYSAFLINSLKLSDQIEDKKDSTKIILIGYFFVNFVIDHLIG